MREQLRFQSANEQVVAERVSDGQKFSLRLWQFEMMRRFDGQRTFEQSSREVYAIFPGGFTAMGLLNFYRWLYQENLVMCECQSIFELVVEDELEAEPAESLIRSVVPKFKERLSEVRDFQLNDWHRQALKVSAMIIFCLGVLRLAYVAAPMFEPPVDRVYAAVENYFLENATEVKTGRSEIPLPESPVLEFELAGQMPAPVEEAPPIVEVNVPPVDALKIEEQTNKIEDLRRALAECRVKRDEFYLQNDEIGYRRQVEIMSGLVREIGEIESGF
tara:strand:+ start:775 stop:1599 length:825 start_codon:yes stop_codon:yes gene_type:complete